MLDLYRFSHFQNVPFLLHAVTTKSSHFPYAFSLALHTGETHQTIVKNRKLLADTLTHENLCHYVVANQTHSDHIKVISSQETKGWHNSTDAIEDCDALITNLPTILTADCVPILLYDKQNHVVAAVHAGWKGTHAQIVKKTVLKMQKVFATNPKDILAGIAPSIGRCCYEIDIDVAKHFLHTPKGFTQKNDKYMLDLPYLNKQQLLDVGVLEANIEMSNLCTACENQRFFSYRKESACTGRFMSMIGMHHMTPISP